MKEIFTNHGDRIKVSDIWYDKLKCQKWYKVRKYAMNIHHETMHRIIMGKPNSDVDHIDGDGLNNQIENLRIATDSQNIANSRIHKNNKSGYKGVYWGNKGWRANIMYNGKTIHLGTFIQIEDAAKAYDRKAIELFGEFAKTNILKITDISL